MVMIIEKNEARCHCQLLKLKHVTSCNVRLLSVQQTTPNPATVHLEKTKVSKFTVDIFLHLQFTRENEQDLFALFLYSVHLKVNVRNGSFFTQPKT